MDIYQGDPNSKDFFKQRAFVAQTGFSRDQLLPDNRSEEQEILNYDDIYSVLAKATNPSERSFFYSSSGDHDRAISFMSIITNMNSRDAALHEIRHPDFFKSNEFNSYFKKPFSMPVSYAFNEVQCFSLLEEIKVHNFNGDVNVFAKYISSKCTGDGSELLSSPGFLKGLDRLLNNADKGISDAAINFIIDFNVDHYYPKIKEALMKRIVSNYERRGNER